MKARRWTGREVEKSRNYWRPRLPLPCRRCGKPVHVDPSKRHEGWTVGHIIDLAKGGDRGINNQWPEHPGCNYSAGGKEGAKLAGFKAKERKPRAQNAWPW